MKRLALLLILAACGGKPAAKEPQSAGLDDEAAVSEARSLIEEAYASLRRGDANGLMPLLAPDAFILGPGDAQVLPAGSDALVSLQDWLEAQNVKKHKLKSRDLAVVASGGGHSAWATDQLELDGGTYAMTAVLTYADELWHFRAINLSRTWKKKQLDGKDALPGAAFPEPTTKPDKDLAELATEAFIDLEARLEQLPDVEDDAAFDVVDISINPRGATHGVKKITKAWNKLLGKDEASKKKKKKKKKPVVPLQIELVGEPGFGTTEDGALAWFCGNLEIENGLPRRMFLLYTKSGDDWRLMALHDAVFMQ